MGMSTHIKGLKTANGPIYKKHAEVLRACINAGIKELSEEVETIRFYNSY